MRNSLLVGLAVLVANPVSAIDWDGGAQTAADPLLAWKSDRQLLQALPNSRSRSVLDAPERNWLGARAGDTRSPEPTTGWRGWVPFAVSLGAWVLVEALAESPKDARWSGENDFDRSARDSLTASSRSGRDVADTVSDYMLYGTIGLWLAERVYAGVQEAGHARKRDPDLTGWQSAGITGRTLLEGVRTDGPWLLLSGVATSGSKAASGRARPKTRDCLDLNDGTDCGGRSGNNSFVSGHTALAGTLAAMTCRHRMERLDRDSVDVGLCVLGSAMAVTTGAMRVVGDEHWTTDAMGGSVVAALFGWALPGALGPARAAEPHSLAPQLRLMPMMADDHYGLRLALRY